MNPVFEAALEVQRFLQERHWRFCIIGGVALQRWGEPRATVDVDLTLLTGFGEEEIATLLGEALEGKSVEEIEVKPAPEIVWYLIGIPLARFGQVQEHVAALEAAAELSVQSSRDK